MGADEYHWAKTIEIVETPAGMEISWDCVWGIRYYEVQYANALSQGMTWYTFPGVIDGEGLERASYLDQTAGGLTMRFYRVREHQQ